MGDLGLGPETALELIEILLRAAAYFFAGFALLSISTYVVFLCLEMLASQRRVKVRIAKVPQPVGCAPVVGQNHDLIFVETPIPVEEATERCCVGTKSELENRKGTRLFLGHLSSLNSAPAEELEET
jgi:hypothetical protein